MGLRHSSLAMVESPEEEVAAEPKRRKPRRSAGSDKDAVETPLPVENPQTRFIKWRALVGDEVLIERLGCKIHTINSICKRKGTESYRKPGLGLALKIASASMAERKRARTLRFVLPILAQEIAEEWG